MDCETIFFWTSALFFRSRNLVIVAMFNDSIRRQGKAAHVLITAVNSSPWCHSYTCRLCCLRRFPLFFCISVSILKVFRACSHACLLRPWHFLPPRCLLRQLCFFARAPLFFDPPTCYSDPPFFFDPPEPFFLTPQNLASDCSVFSAGNISASEPP